MGDGHRSALAATEFADFRADFSNLLKILESGMVHSVIEYQGPLADKTAGSGSEGV